MNIMQTKWILLLAAAVSAVSFSGCTAMSRASLDYIGAPVNVYETGYSFASEAHRNDTSRGMFNGAFTYADYTVDSKIAGERQDDEVSMYIITAPKQNKVNWSKLPEHIYAPIHCTRFDNSDSGLSSDDFVKQIYNNPRAVELDKAFSAVHKISSAVVEKKCEMIVDAINDTIPTYFQFDKPAYEDLYMNRMWSPIATTIATFRYASSYSDKRRNKMRKQLGPFLDNPPFVEELRGTNQETNVVLIRKHPIMLKWLPFTYVDTRPKAYMTHYRCSPEAIAEARKAELDSNKPLRDEYERLVKKYDLNPI